MTVTRDELRRFIESRFEPGGRLQDETPLLTSTIIDSFGLVELLGFIEAGSGIKIRPTEVTLEHFDSVDRIMAFLGSRDR